jgi:DNA polymerase-1
LGIAVARVSEMMEGILSDTGVTDYAAWLSDSRENNFRFKIYPQYKANRPPQPHHLQDLKEYAIMEWGFLISHGQEADDSLGIHQSKTDRNATIICSIDKDLLTIPGLHWNFVKKEKTVVSPMGALANFYTQFLIGDSADNIDGCDGIGKAKAPKILAPCETEEEMFEAVVKTYMAKNPGKSPDEILTHIAQIGRVLKIRTEENEPLWSFPKSRLMEEIGQLFIQPMEEEIGQFTELITTG